MYNTIQCILLNKPIIHAANILKIFNFNPKVKIRWYEFNTVRYNTEFDQNQPLHSSNH